MSDLTPMMQQYMSIKRRYNDAILFFRLGDFYEMFFDDAKIAARTLDLALTSRNKGGGEKAAMAGVPYHSADTYIAKLINNGYKVAICEQIEDPKEASGIVDRDVIRVITPGTVIENEILNENENNYLAAAVMTDNKIGFSYIDISTGEFFVTEVDAGNKEKIFDEIDRIQPQEIIISKKLNSDKLKLLIEKNKILVNDVNFKKFNKAYKYLLEQFQIKSLASFGIEDMDGAVSAAGEILKFINDTQKRTLEHIDKLKYYNLNQYMILDSSTRKNLELTSTIQDKKRNGSLLDILDNTITSMGSRLIKKWINQPLINKKEIDGRLDAVQELVNDFMELQVLKKKLDGIYDLERILTKITYGTANARDLAALKYSLSKLPTLKKSVEKLDSDYFIILSDKMDSLEDILKLLENSIVDDPPVTLREGGLIKEGYNTDLDNLRKTCNQGKEWISNLQKTERERTDISSLKVGYNKVFGYYIEVTNANLDKVPDNYTRKQTLSNSERYIIPKLKEKEAEVLGAEEKINDLEYELFVDVRDEIGKNISRIKNTAEVIAVIDVICSLSSIAIKYDFNRPEINNSTKIKIKEGRHPVVEKMVDNNFVPNDTELDNEFNRFIIITGPNMSGKSTYMRQVALIVLMAQMGSFVPAADSEIGIVDRIFTRVGASDDLTTGQSTFMVEMNEVANIINNATAKSLIILDEVGRGTSTYDGLSIAWAVSEYINDPDLIGARSLFATHYHELTRLSEKYSTIKNYNVLVEEDDNGVHFLHKIVPGSADDSYGIEVARLAGLPDNLIRNAQKILEQLEKKDNEVNNISDEKDNTYISEKNNSQLSLFEKNNPVIQKIVKADLLNMSPLDAINFLYELQKEARKEGK
ncbi:MAG: DNA mismatch repair protein MutS [bacterium]